MAIMIDLKSELPLYGTARWEKVSQYAGYLIAHFVQTHGQRHVTVDRIEPGVYRLVEANKHTIFTETWPRRVLRLLLEDASRYSFEVERILENV